MFGRTDPSNSDHQNGDGGGFVCARVCVRACVQASVRVCVRDVFVIYDNNTLPKLIMILIVSCRKQPTETETPERRRYRHAELY